MIQCTKHPKLDLKSFKMTITGVIWHELTCCKLTYDDSTGPWWLWRRCRQRSLFTTHTTWQFMPCNHISNVCWHSVQTKICANYFCDHFKKRNMMIYFFPLFAYLIYKKLKNGTISSDDAIFLYYYAIYFLWKIWITQKAFGISVFLWRCLCWRHYSFKMPFK